MRTWILGVVAVVGLIAILGVTISLPPSNASFVVKSGTYANSQVDTVWYGRRTDLAGAAFSASWSDSVSVTNIIMRRTVAGTIQPVIAGDTLFTAFTGTSTTQKLGTIVLAPLPSMYVFIVTYASSANGFTTPTVNYSVNQQLYTR